jgi:hypothetical protein
LRTENYYMKMEIAKKLKDIIATRSGTPEMG